MTSYFQDEEQHKKDWAWYQEIPKSLKRKILEKQFQLADKINNRNAQFVMRSAFREAVSICKKEFAKLDMKKYSDD